MNTHHALRRLTLACLLAAGTGLCAAETTTGLALATDSWARDTGSGEVTVSLYASAALGKRGDIVSASGAKRLRIVLKQRLSSDQIGRLLLRDVERHAAPGQFAAHVNSLLLMGQAFGTRKDLAAGHSFGFEFVPGSGTRLLIDDEAASAFVADPSFFTLVLGPWLGQAESTPARLAQR